MKGQKFLVSQIVAQGRKIKSWEILVTKLDILSFVVPNIKHVSLFVDFISTLEQSWVNESVFLPTWNLSLQTAIAGLNLKYHVISSQKYI